MLALVIVGVCAMSGVAIVAAQERPVQPSVTSPSAISPQDAELVRKLMSCSVILNRQGFLLIASSTFDFTLYTSRADHVADEVYDITSAAGVPDAHLRTLWDRYEAQAEALDEGAVKAGAERCLVDADVKRAARF
jgi:hypothetical protein